MSNYIRACFCIVNPVQTNQFYDLLRILTDLDCRYNFWTTGSISGYLSLTNQDLSTEESTLDQSPNLIKLQQIAEWLANPSYLDVQFGWQIDDNLYKARLLQRWYSKDQTRALSFDVEDAVFLPGRSIKFTSHDSSPSFDRFKQIIVELIKYTKPIIGVIDYEADLLCDPPRKHGSLVSWGNYFSQSILDQWLQNDVKTFLKIASESIVINQLGILSFIHPLEANQAWTSRHQEIQTLLARNSIT